MIMSRKLVSSSEQSVSSSKKSYSPEFREKAVKMVTELGYSVPDVARQLGCSTAAIPRWKADATPLDPEVSQRMLLGEDEHKRLRKENARLKMEVEILKQATAYFAKDTM
jgi:transposase-like protein